MQQVSPMSPQHNQTALTSAVTVGTPGVQINSQLEQMLYKLKTKVQNEVQQRIENQRKLNAHLQ